MRRGSSSIASRVGRLDDPVSRPNARGAAARGLFRHPGPIEPYPAEPSDEELAAAVGLDVSAIVRMDMNTLGGGPLPAVAAALADGGEVVEYNDLGYRALRAAISAATGAPAARIIPGAGGDELIRLLTAVAVGPGDAVVVPTPTFPMFAVEAALAGGQVAAVPRTRLRERQSVDAIRDAAVSSSARLVWICSRTTRPATSRRWPRSRRSPTAFPRSSSSTRCTSSWRRRRPALRRAACRPCRSSAVCPTSSSCAPFRRRTASPRRGSAISWRTTRSRHGSTDLASRFRSPGRATAWRAPRSPTRQQARARHELLGTERARLEAAFDGLGWERLPSVANFVLFRPPDAGSARGRPPSARDRAARVRGRPAVGLAARHRPLAGRERPLPGRDPRRLRPVARLYFAKPARARPPLIDQAPLRSAAETRLRRAYGFEEVALVPGAVTADPGEVDLTVDLAGVALRIPFLAAAMDAVVDTAFATRMTEAGGVGFINLEGLYTRYEDAGPIIEQVAAAEDGRAAAHILADAYAQPVRDDLIGMLIRRIKAAGGIAAVATTPASAWHHAEVAARRPASTCSSSSRR